MNDDIVWDIKDPDFFEQTRTRLFRKFNELTVGRIETRIGII